MTSLKDISEICRVSVTTVSKALNGRRDVGKETRKRILQVAKALHYTAKGEEAGQEEYQSTLNLGILMPAMTGAPDGGRSGGRRLNLSRQEAGMICGFCEAAMQNGYDITLLNVDDCSGYQISYLARCRYRQVDGVFVLRRGEEVYEKRVMELLRDDLPVLTLEQVADYKQMLPGDAVMLGRAAARKLIASAAAGLKMADFTPDGSENA